MKYKLTWKDPEWYDGHDISDEEFEKIQALGIGEYLTIEVDTDSGEVSVRKPRKHTVGQ